MTIDFDGTIDGQPFAGGKGEDVAFVLGEGRMLSDFEAGVSGMKAGESKTIVVKFPDDYHGKDIAGKEARFEIKVKKVEQGRLPELDAEFAKSLGVADGDLGKMRAEIKSNVEREVRQRLSARLKSHVMQALLDSTKVDVPKALVDGEAQRLVGAAAEDLKARGLKIEDMPIGPQVFEEQARRRVALGLIMGLLIVPPILSIHPWINSLMASFPRTIGWLGGIMTASSAKTATHPAASPRS